MAGIGGLSDATSSTIRGYGGVASGLDRDSLIEGMTKRTTDKIEKYKGKRTTLQWKQQAVRGITDQLINFGDKYTSTLASGSNLYGNLWNKSNIKVLGSEATSKFITASGNGNSKVSILGVKQLAEKASIKKAGGASDKTLKSKPVNFEDSQAEKLKGKSLTFNVDGQSVNLTLKNSVTNYPASGTGGYASEEILDWSSTENIKNSLNKILNEKDAQGNYINPLQGKISFGVDSGDSSKLTIQSASGSTANVVKLTGGSALSSLGVSGEHSIKDGSVISSVTSKSLTSSDLLTDPITFAEKVAGKQITFEYNGDIRSFRMPSLTELAQTETDAQGNTVVKKDSSGKVLQKTDEEMRAKIEESLQRQFDDAYGQGRVKVSFTNQGASGSSDPSHPNNYELKFETMQAGTTVPDPTSTLRIVNGDSALVGANGALGIKSGDNNRINTNAKLTEAGFGLTDADFGPTGEVKVKINGTELSINRNDTVDSLINKINANTNVNVSYQYQTDEFTITAKASGAGGVIDITSETGLKTGAGMNVMKKMFGDGVTTVGGVRGQDAIIAVQYEGSNATQEIHRGENNFEIDGMTVGVKGTFGYDAGGQLTATPADAVRFEASVDTQKITDTVKSMIEDYNKLVDSVNGQVSTKPDRSYHPLTREEKKEMSKEEIELYENKAKEGLLFADSDLRMLADDMRFVINPIDLQALEEIGISVSGQYMDNGKITFDEEKFKAALQTDPDKVQHLLTKSEAEGGSFASNMSGVVKKYANNIGTYGTLVEKAGTTKAPRSIDENFFERQIREMNRQIDNLNKQLKLEQDRYIKQFTSLENVIAQMNAQSSWLAQIGGGF